MMFRRYRPLATAAADLLLADIGAEAWVPAAVITQMRETVTALTAMNLPQHRAPVVAPAEFRAAFPD
jgi:hypothetical protein